tara:strand:- start:1273 stop:1497 length:225 start_codon:yes stop_codon:yes gene_type:complete
MKNILYKAFMSHAQGHIDKHVANVNVMLEKPVGIGEHPDIIETIEKEMKIVAEYEDLKANMEKHFGQEKGILSE